MADTDVVLDALARALSDAASLSAIEGVHTRELDISGTDASKEFPLIELQPISETQGGIGFVEYAYDDNGNAIGEIYEWATELRVQIDIWTMSGSEYDAVTLGTSLKRVLFQYSEGGYDSLLTDEDGEGIAEISLQMGSGSTANTEGLSGGSMFLRRWRQDVICTYVTRVDTLEEYGPLPYIKDVNTPRDGDFHGTSEPGETKAEPPYADGFSEAFGLDFNS